MGNLLGNLDTLLITNPINIRYLTGFEGLSPDEREAYLLVTEDKLYLFTSSLYLEQAKGLTKNYKMSVVSCKLTIVEISREEPLAEKLREILKQVQDNKKEQIRLGFEETDLRVTELRQLKDKLKQVELITTAGRVEELRKIKRPDEIENIRKAAQLTDQCFKFILKKLKLGVVETQIAWEIESFFRKNGAESAFSPIVAFDKNSSQPHYAPTHNHSASWRITTHNQLVLLDFGARINGYCSDMTRVVFMGKPTTEQQRAYNTVLSANKKVFSKLNDCYNVSINRNIETDISGAELDRVARKVIENAGLPPYPHSLGHNVGLAIHEGPRLSIKKDEELKPGMVFTIEPAIYLEGKFGIRIEDLVQLTETGPEILTKSSKKLIVIE